MLSYRYNLRLCQRFYGALNPFEVMLRNAINEHYSDSDWIVSLADTGKLLEYNKDEIRQTETGYRRRGSQHHHQCPHDVVWSQESRVHHCRAVG